MQAKTARKPSYKFELVESSQFPGCYVAQAIDDTNEGVIVTVEFVAHDSKRLAEEYIQWKNSSYQSQPST
jgi:hypothetical protein